MILSTRLVNWRSHSNSFLQFRKGTNLLIGPMGSGKSSVLDGISFALFGTFPALERRRLKLSDVIRANETYAEVSVEFLWSNSKYRVTRKINRKKESTSTEAKLLKDEKLVEEGTERVTDYIENLLGVNYNLFTRAIYSEQNNIDYFLSVDPRKRKEEIDRLLGLDRFERIRANTITLINRVKNERKALEQKFNKNHLIELIEKQEDARKKITELKKLIEELTAIVEKEKKTMQEKEAQLKELSRKKEEYERLNQEKIKNQTMIERLEQELKGKEFSAQRLEEIRRKRDAILKEKNQKQIELNEINNLFASVSSKRGVMETKIKIATKTKEQLETASRKFEELLAGSTIAQIREELMNQEKELLGLLSEQKMIEKTINENEKLAKALSPDIKTCPLCGAELTETKIRDLIKEREIKLKEARKRLDEILHNVKIKEKTVNSMRIRVRELDKLNSQLQTLKKDYTEPEKIEQELKLILEELSRLKKEKTKLENILNEINKKSENVSLELQEYEQLGKRKNELEKTKQNLEIIKKQSATLLFDPKEYESKRIDYEESRVSYERKLTERNSKVEELRAVSQMAELIEKDIKYQKDIENRIADLTKAEDELGIYKNLVLETQLSLRNEMIDGINIAMNEIWEIFYPHKNYREVKLSITEKDYELMVFDGKWKSLESIASGGERACVALTLRVALAMVLTPNLSWLILDEPTHNLDKDAIELLSNTLQYKVPEVVEQTFVITHDESLVGSEFASSYKLTRDKEANGPTHIEIT